MVQRRIEDEVLPCWLRWYPKINEGVSTNTGTPKSSILIGFSIINHPFWGTPIFGNTHEHHWASETSQDAWIWRSFEETPQICMNWHFWQIRLDSKNVRFYHNLSNSPFHTCLNKVENIKSRQHSACILGVSCNLSYRYVSLPIGSMSWYVCLYI